MYDRMSVALRVLTFVEDHTNPLQADIESLRGWVDIGDCSADPDELACMVINAEIQHRKKVRIIRSQRKHRSERN